VRTNTDVPKHKGISALIIDMQSPGVQPRPFPELTDPAFTDFNEVFFDAVRVPRDQLLGEIDHGWPITQGSLAHERAMLWIDYAYSTARAVDALIALGDEPAVGGGRIGDDPVFRDQVAELAIDARAVLCMGYRGFSKFMAGKSSSEHSLLKLFGSESMQRALQLGATALGTPGLDRRRLGPQMWREGAWLTQWMRSFGGTIPGGTSEIQRNIIAERVLGLPRK
jgi:alkylation response protein AidB-like acyl-CoA dehydrogenase